MCTNVTKNHIHKITIFQNGDIIVIIKCICYCFSCYNDYQLSRVWFQGCCFLGVDEGVPQDSILDVILFSIKIHSIVKCLGNGIDGSLHVDDFLICYQPKYMNTIERPLQLCLNKIQKWADENGFKFFQTKTVCIFVI